MLPAFALDPSVVHLNHGSFGACPRAVLEEQQRWRDRLEAATMRFFVLDYPPALAAARARLAELLRADADGLAFVPNATTGVAAALESLVPRDADVVTTDHAYAACRHALDRIVGGRGGRVITAHVEAPVRDPGQHVDAIVAAVTPKTRLLLLDHVTSPTGLVLDVAAIVRALRGRELMIVVDGAHAPGMLDLDVGALDVDVYVGNLHKWTCAPKGVGFLWAHPRHRDRLRPVVTSHGHTFRDAFDWTGTHDPSASLCVPAAIDEIARLGGGWPAVRDHNHRLVLAMRELLHAALGGAPLAPASMLGSMAAIAVTLPAPPRDFERRLLEAGWEVAIADWPRLGAVYVRVSAHLYNTLHDAQLLAAHLVALGVRGA